MQMTTIFYRVAVVIMCILLVLHMWTARTLEQGVVFQVDHASLRNLKNRRNGSFRTRRRTPERKILSDATVGQFTIYEVPFCYLCHDALSTIMASCGHLCICADCLEYQMQNAGPSCPVCLMMDVSFIAVRGLVAAQMIKPNSNGILPQVELPLCTVCYERVATYVSKPCGHLLFCQVCQKTINVHKCSKTWYLLDIVNTVKLAGLTVATNPVPRRMFEAPECVVCKAQPSNVILDPCGHLAFCKECLKRNLEVGARRCPLCRAYIHIYRKVQGIIHLPHTNTEVEHQQIKLPLCLGCQRFTSQYMMTPCGHIGLCRACQSTQSKQSYRYCSQCDEVVAYWVRIIINNT